MKHNVAFSLEDTNWMSVCVDQTLTSWTRSMAVAR